MDEEATKTRGEAQATLFRQIAKAGEDATYAPSLLMLAEAWAWLSYPNQAHGGPVALPQKLKG